MNQTETPQLPSQKQIWQKTLGWQPSLEQQQQFQQLYQGILAGNLQLNLTRITTPEDFWEKHLWDSLTGVSNWLSAEKEPESLKVIDIGTGAGFPGLPIAIAFPHWQVTLLDSTRKKIAFLNSLIAQLGINNVKTLVGRAEAIGQQRLQREAYDLALIRAVGQASVCAEYAVPLVKRRGEVILYRGHWESQESEELNCAAEQLGSRIQSVTAWHTPLTNSVRHCIYLHKHSPTPERFPRSVGIPHQQPL